MTNSQDEQNGGGGCHESSLAMVGGDSVDCDFNANYNDNQCSWVFSTAVGLFYRFLVIRH